MRLSILVFPFSLALATVALVLLVTGMQNQDVDAQIARQKGISYTAWWPGEYSKPDADIALSNLRSAGADWISLLVTQYQDDISSTAIHSTTSTPTDADLIHVITRAHSLGVKVMLKPHVDLANDPSHWRGQIGQGFTETQWATWFASYQNFINHYAQLAQAHGADQFCVGTELNETQGQASRWRAVIAGIRSLYLGPITYAATAGYEIDPTWWDAVDYIGVDAYYPLTTKNDPTIAELKAAWVPYIGRLASLASTWGKPIIFTEIGYRSQDGANQHPGDWQTESAVDLQEQADAYQAAFESAFNQTWCAGMFWWSWGTDPFEGGACDDGYTPHNKPAEDILRTWYAAPPRVSIIGRPQPDYRRTLVVYADALGSGWDDWSWDSTVDSSSTDRVYRGTVAISATIGAGGGLSFHHASFDSSPYHWLEFYVYGTVAGQQVRAFANDENDTGLRHIPVCIELGTWKQVRVPLSDMNAAGRFLQRISIDNPDSQPSSFWVDDIRLVGATWTVYLPGVVRSN